MSVAPEVDPVTRSPIDTQFVDPVAKELAVSEIADFQPLKPHQDARLSLPVPKAEKPFGKRLPVCGSSIATDLEHGYCILYVTEVVDWLRA